MFSFDGEDDLRRKIYMLKQDNTELKNENDVLLKALEKANSLIKELEKELDYED